MFKSFVGIGLNRLCKIQMTDGIGASTSWAYNRASDLTSVTLPSGKTVSFANDAVGRRNVTAFPNGLSEKATFATPLSGTGATGNLTSIAHGLLAANATGSAVNLKLGTTSYTYDVRGNIMAANQNTVPARNRSFVYDIIQRLTSVTDGAGTALESYTLDGEGNRITSHLSSFHVTNPANRLTEDQDYIYEYSLTGSLVTKAHKADGITWRYDYDPLEQLIRARKFNGTSLSDAVLSDMKYTYDGFGRLIDERHTIGTANTREFRRVYDGENLAWREEGDGFFYSNRNWFTHGAGTDDLMFCLAKL